MRTTLRNKVFRVGILVYMLTHCSLSFAQGDVSLFAGDITTLSYSYASRIQSVGWYISNPSVVGITSSTTYTVSAIIKGLSAGTATITAKYYYWDSDYLHLLNNEVTWYVTVTLPEPSSISLKADSVTIHKSKYLYASLYPELAKRDLTWESSDNTTVTVDEFGKITGIKIGTADITVKTHNGLSATGKITVHPVYVESVEISDVEYMLCGRPQRLQVSVFPEDATYREVTWNSSNNDIATVIDGMVYPKQCGEVEVTATAIDNHHKAASRKFLIKPVLTEQIEMNQPTAEITKYESLQLSTIFSPEDVTYKDVIWESSNENVAIVHDGLVYAKKPGKSTITATVTDGTELSTTCEVTVHGYDYQATMSAEEFSAHSQSTESVISVPLNLETNFPVTNMQFDVRLPEGVSLNQVKCGDIVSDNHSMTFSKLKGNIYRVLCSSNKNVPFVARSGVVAVLSMKVEAGMKSGTQEINIEQAFLSDIDIPSTLFKMQDISIKMNVFTIAEGISLDKEVCSIDVGGTIQLIATIYPENATIKDVVWSSNDESIATVEDGFITAHAEGVATITASTTDGSLLSASCEVKVFDPAITIVFEDEKVKELCVANWDNNHNGELSYAEASAVKSIGTIFQKQKEIVSFDELQYFTGLQILEHNAFQGCSNLNVITIPANVMYIDGGVFRDCRSLKVLSILRDTPPFTTLSNNFENINLSNVQLIVPLGSVSIYKAHNIYTKFGLINDGTLGLEITNNNQEFVYSGKLPELEFINLNDLSLSYDTEVLNKDVGKYSVLISVKFNKGIFAGSINMHFNYVITKAPLKITAKDYTIKQGQPLPEFEVTYDGFKNDETSEVLWKQPVIETTATSESEPGEYEITVYDAEAQNYEITYFKGKLTIEKPDYISGDVNGDGLVNVTDIVATVNYIMEKPSDNFNKDAADLNGDGEVNVTDIVMMVSIIMNGDGGSSRRAAATPSHLVINRNNIQLRNADAYTAAQFDINLSDGQSINNVVLNVSSDHSLYWKMVDANTYRVVVYSMTNAAFRANSDNLFTVFMTGSQNATISNELLIKADGTTGIDAIRTEAENGNVYDLNGRQVKNPRKGVYIINGKKMIVK